MTVGRYLCGRERTQLFFLLLTYPTWRKNREWLYRASFLEGVVAITT